MTVSYVRGKRTREGPMENKIEEVAFALLSAGVFRGQQKLETVFSIAIQGAQEFVNKNDDGEPIVQDISLVAFSAREKNSSCWRYQKIFLAKVK
jgi:hypothetical protein